MRRTAAEVSIYGDYAQIPLPVSSTPEQLTFKTSNPQNDQVTETAEEIVERRRRQNRENQRRYRQNLKKRMMESSSAASQAEPAPSLPSTSQIAVPLSQMPSSRWSQGLDFGSPFGLTSDDTNLDMSVNFQGLTDLAMPDISQTDQSGLYNFSAPRGTFHKPPSVVSVEAVSGLGNTPLLQAALNGHTTIVKLLIERQASVATVNAQGQTALHLAAHNGHTEIVQLLLNLRIHPDPVDTNGNTPLLLAASRGHHEIVTLLMDAGADINRQSGHM